MPSQVVISDFCTPNPKSKGAGSAGKKYLQQYDKQDLNYSTIKTDIHPLSPKPITLARTHPYYSIFPELAPIEASLIPAYNVCGRAESRVD